MSATPFTAYPSNTSHWKTFPMKIFAQSKNSGHSSGKGEEMPSVLEIISLTSHNVLPRTFANAFESDMIGVRLQFVNKIPFMSKSFFIFQFFNN